MTFSGRRDTMKESEIKCCGERVKIIEFGYGYIAICPLCRTVVYNSKTKPEDR